ncbi:MAG: sulfotransferase [Bacteroidota bacterium]
MASWRKRFGMLPEPEPEPMPRPVFVAGCMRSGTTFLLDKLSQHPQLLKVGAELRGVWTEIGDAASMGPLSEAKRADQAHYLAATNMAHYLSAFIRESQNLRRHLMRAKNYYRYGQGRIRYDWPQVRPVNKSTQLVNKLAYAHRLFPQSQIILIIRGIEGHSASMKRFIEHNYQREQIVHVFPEQTDASWTRLPEKALPEGLSPERRYPNHFATIPQMWLQLNLRALRDLEALPRESYRVVLYEELVQEQAHYLGQLFDFLNLASEHQLEAGKIARSKLTITNTSTQGDPLEKWKKHLSESEIKILADMKLGPGYLELEERLASLKMPGPQ